MARPRGLKRLVDDGYDINKKMKVLKKELDEIKEELKEYHHNSGDGKSTLIINGGHASALIYHSSTPAEARPRNVWAAMKPDMDRFLDVVKIKVTELRKAVSKSKATELLESESLPYSRVKFAGKEEAFTPALIGRLTRKIRA